MLCMTSINFICCIFYYSYTTADRIMQMAKEKCVVNSKLRCVFYVIVRVLILLYSNSIFTICIFIRCVFYYNCRLYPIYAADGRRQVRGRKLLLRLHAQNWRPGYRHLLHRELIIIIINMWKSMIYHLSSIEYFRCSNIFTQF